MTEHSGNPYCKTTPPAIEAKYYATTADVAKAHGIHATRIATALVTPEHHDGHFYTRRAILHPFIIFFDRRPDGARCKTGENCTAAPR